MEAENYADLYIYELRDCPMDSQIEALVVLAELIEQNNDATLDELCQMLYEKLGINISRATMGRMTQRLQLTVKKNSVPE